MEAKLTGGLLVFFLLILTPLIRAEGKDQTIVPNIGSTDIVDATVAKLNLLTEQNADLRADNRFMRRIAWVETRDGTADHTYSVPTYHGGIWRVDEAVYRVTRAIANRIDTSLFDDIERLFCIRWSQTTWQDCRKPLYSALAARIFFHDRHLIPQDLEGQADIWYQNYHAQQTNTKENFVAKVTTLEQIGCNANGFDLVFVLDGSGSVGASHFNTTKNFVLGMIDFFDIGPGDTKVGVIQYSSEPQTEFYLKEYTEKATLKQAARSIVYKGGGTRTDDALDLMSNTAFLPENGARTNRGFPRVAIVVTDGQSGGNVMLSAQRAREMGIIIFAIGVTNNVRDYELNAIANTPNDTYVYHVSDFSAISNIAAVLKYTTCVQATEIGQNETINSTLNSNDVQHFEVPVSDDGATLTVDATQGTVTLYISYSTPNPNEASHDDKVEVSEEDGTVTIGLSSNNLNMNCIPESARKRRQADNQDGGEAGSIIGIVYITIEGKQDTNDFVLTVTEGDFTDPLTTMTASTQENSINGCGFVAGTMAYVLVNAIFLYPLASTNFY